MTNTAGAVSVRLVSETVYPPSRNLGLMYAPPGGYIYDTSGLVQKQVRNIRQFTLANGTVVIDRSQVQETLYSYDAEGRVINTIQRGPSVNAAGQPITPVQISMITQYDAVGSKKSAERKLLVGLGVEWLAGVVFQPRWQIGNARWAGLRREFQREKEVFFGACAAGPGPAKPERRGARWEENLRRRRDDSNAASRPGVRGSGSRRRSGRLPRWG